MGKAQGEDREGRPVHPARWGKTSPARSVSFWGRFLLFWLVISGLGALSLFLFLYQFFSSSLTAGYGGSFHALRPPAEILPSVVAISMLAYVLLVGGGAALLCIALIHRIAGPIFRLERSLENCLDGGPVNPFFPPHGGLVPGLH